MEIKVAMTECLVLIALISSGQISCQNAKLSGLPETVPLGSSVTLTCNYIRGDGRENVQAISWFNGSTQNVMTLQLISTDPYCEIFITDEASYSSSRINFTCDPAKDIYTLTINPVQECDSDVTWSCTFYDPSPNTNRSTFTIVVSEVISNGGGVNDGINLGAIIGSTIVFVAICAVIVLAVLWVHLKQNRTYRTGEIDEGKILDDKMHTDSHKEKNSEVMHDSDSEEGIT